MGIPTDRAHRRLAPEEALPLMNKENMILFTTHCFLHREVLLLKPVNEEILKVWTMSNGQLY